MNETLIFLEGNARPIKILSDGLINPYSVFVGINDDIYVDNGYPNGHLDKWTLNTNESISIMNIDSYCYGIFIDINDNIYCSLRYLHKVVMKSLNDSEDKLKIVAGNGSIGSLSHMVYYPCGIFVDIKLNLYVADSSNGRIQKYSQGNLNGTTIAGKGATSIRLSTPTGIILDDNGYLFIADRGNHRIMLLSPNGFLCILGCSNKPGSSSDQLSLPGSLSFDSHANLFISDSRNGRIQKFNFLSNSCGKIHLINIEFLNINLKITFKKIFFHR
jgi:DNA-binding beta-propeller fold protein YncE